MDSNLTSPNAPRRLVVRLDLSADDVPCVNYKKLLKEQGGGASARSEKDSAKSSAEKRARDAIEAKKTSGGGPAALLEPTNTGGHMAAVIRRIEALYQGGRGEASSDDEDESGESGESGDEEEEEEEGDGDEEGDGESGDDDDSGSEMEDPDDKPTMTPNGTRVVEPTAPSAGKADKPAKKKKAKKKADRDWYDVDDDFIDDDELDEYFEDDGLKTKHSGFFINKGELQKVDEEGRTPVKAAAVVEDEEDEKPKKKDRKKRTAQLEWTQESKQLLTKAVQTYGLRWQMICDSGEFDELKPYTAARMARQWKMTQEDLLKRGIEVIIPNAPPPSKVTSAATLTSTATTSNKENDDGDAGLSTPAKRSAQGDVEAASTGKKQKTNGFNENDPRHPNAKRRVVESLDAEMKKLKDKVDEECAAIRQAVKSKATTSTPPAVFKWEWTADTTELFYRILARLFFAFPKTEASRVWSKLQLCFPDDFDVTLDALRKKYVSVQKKKTADEKSAILGLTTSISVATTPT
jgi:hypothetical protein|uniref:Hpc2-related domain-containing protein n=1 Tax=Ostreococcus mediterraneus TaxID=1486918 RepID=A0A7S1ENK8_9CHLO|mmetsp:Transcript_8595/g.19450  ORF Transcript_8595/g.19450 Transcript_8595/m.19450 type:complete len:521 (+) Transcript_8595:188-1750(+)